MIKVITRKKSERIAKFAFDYAMKNGRKKVTCVHKANIMYVKLNLFFLLGNIRLRSIEHTSYI